MNKTNTIDAVTTETLNHNLKALLQGKTIVAVHDGVFHADDIAALALIRCLGSSIPYCRTRDKAVLEDTGTLAVDVGKGLFDHHQEHIDFMLFDDGTKVPHCGVSKLYAWLTGDTTFTAFYSHTSPIVQAMAYTAAIDNGAEAPAWAVPAFDFVRHFNAAWNEPESVGFPDALLMATHVWRRLFVAEAADPLAQRYLRSPELQKVCGGRVALLPSGGMKWADWAQEPEQQDLLFVVFPGNPSTPWYVQCVPPTAARWKEQRCAFPESFRAKDAGELAIESCVMDAVFCHKLGFIAGAGSLDGAVRLAQAAMQAAGVSYE